MNHTTPAQDQLPEGVRIAAQAHLRGHQEMIWARADRLFAGLLIFEWVAEMLLAVVRSPRTWSGATSSIHPHVWAATVLGAVIISLPVYLAFAAPGRTLTRHAIAVGQMLMSGLLIHLGDGRIEMHFHVFGSLAFLQFYRDWRVLITASAVVAADHLLRGIYYPESVYGVDYIAIWRTVEHAGWVVFEDIFLISACLRAVREMQNIAQNRALLEASHHLVEQKVLERTQELKEAQAELVKSARSAGMAEIATSVLHNVGNVLNSVNISAGVVTDTLAKSEVASLTRLSDLVRQHKADLGDYITRDASGRMIPDFIGELAVCLEEERNTLTAEVTTMSRGVEHIKQIVAAQQNMAKRKNLIAAVRPTAVIESALAMQGMHAGRDTQICREFADVPEVMMDQHKVLQILINLISNARQAVAPLKDHGTVTLTSELVDSAEGTRLRLKVKDNGTGIAPENLARIFSHGFTTKKDGHGFGLHSSANAAAEMGGRLVARSEGLGKGSTFELEIPVTLAMEAASCNN